MHICLGEISQGVKLLNVYNFLEELRNRYYSQLSLIIDRYEIYKDKSCIIQDTFLEKYSCGFTANFDPYNNNFRVDLISLTEISIDMKFDTWLNREIELIFKYNSTDIFSILFSKNKTTIKFYSNFRYYLKSKDRQEYIELIDFLNKFSWNEMPRKSLEIDEDISMAILSDDQRISLSFFDMILSDLEN